MQTTIVARSAMLLAGLTLCSLFNPVRTAASEPDEFFVSPTGKHIHPYDSWENAATDIQTAVTAAPAGSTVWLGAGEYSPAGSGRMVTIDKSLSLRGAAAREHVVIDGNGTRSGILIALSDEANANVLVESLTITNCLVTGSGVAGSGGGIRIGSSSTGTVIVNDCVITDNEAAVQGGGIYASGSGLHVKLFKCMILGNRALHDDQRSGGGGFFTGVRVLMRDCTIAGNSGPRSGGGLSFENVAATSEVRNCLIEHNQSGNRGGGVEVHSLGPLFENCTIRFNTAGGFGGGVRLQGHADMRNCLVHGNTGASGGGVSTSHGNYEVLIENCTIVDNEVSTQGGGIHNWNNPDLVVRNSIVYYNLRAGGPNNISQSGTGTFEYSCIPGPPAGTGNIHGPPEFMDFDGGDFRLTADSPGVNAGTNQVWMIGARDLAGRPRIGGETVDMGCFEYHPPGTVILIR